MAKVLRIHEVMKRHLTDGGGKAHVSEIDPSEKEKLAFLCPLGEIYTPFF